MVDPDHPLLRNGREDDATTTPTRSPSPPATLRTRTYPHARGAPTRPKARWAAPSSPARATPQTTPRLSPRAIRPQVLHDVTNEGGGDPTSGGEPENGKSEAGPTGAITVTVDGEELSLRHGSAVIAAITSCTNTSNPSVMMGAGLLARKAVERGLSVAPHVKTSLAPGSKVVTEYLQTSGLLDPLEQAEVRRGRLRVHDVHRELRSAGRGDLRRRRGERPRRRRRPLGQPQLRRAASTPTSARTTWPPRRSSSPTPWRARWT